MDMKVCISSFAGRLSAYKQVAHVCVFGSKVLSLDDQFVDLADKCIDQLALALRPGAYLVDALPLRKYASI